MWLPMGSGASVFTVTGTFAVVHSGATVLGVDSDSNVTIDSTYFDVDAGGITTYGVSGNSTFSVDGAGNVMQEGHLVLPLSNDAVTPTLAFGDGDTGFYESTDNIIKIAIGTALRWEISDTRIGATALGGGALLSETPTYTNPTLLPTTEDVDTGIGTASATNNDTLSLIAGGVEGMRLGTSGSTVFTKLDVGAASSTAMVNITPGSAIVGLMINQDNGASALIIDSENTGGVWAIAVNAKYGIISTQDISNGQGSYVQRGIAEAGTAPLSTFFSSHASTTQSSVFIDHNGTGGAAGYALHVDSENAAAPAVQIEGAYTVALRVKGGLGGFESGVSVATLADGSGVTYYLNHALNYGIWIGSDGIAYVKDATSSRAIQ